MSLIRSNGEKKIDSDIGTDEREGVDLNTIPKPCLMIERTHLLFVNSPHCSTKWANLSPTGISGYVKIGSGKDWLSELCVEDKACLEDKNCL